MITLKKIDDTNFYECIQLEVGGEQKDFVAPNVISLAQAYVAIANETCKPLPFAVYNDNVMVGFVQIAYEASEDNDDENEYCIWRFMIDKKFQHRSYGKQALLAVLEYIKTFPCGEAKSIVLSYEPANTTAKALYESVGFVATGEVEEGEIVSKLSL